MNHLWNVQLLGGLRAEQSGQIITRFRTQKAGALFAFLALFPNRSHTREELVERFWPDADPEAGRTSLRSALASLRRQLEGADGSDGAVLVTRGHTDVLLEPEAIATDVAAFEKLLKSASKSANTPEERARLLTEAVTVYKGPLLPGFYDSWALAERDRLSECCLDALAQLVAYHEQIGQITEALAFARRAVSADPLREEAHTDVIRLLIASGEQAAARQQFDQMQSVLDKELGMEPSEEARALVSGKSHSVAPTQRKATSETAAGQNAPSPDVIDRAHPSHSLPEPSSRPAPSGRSESRDTAAIIGPVSLPLTLNRFFGRDSEIAALSERLRHTDTRLVTLTGAGGSGKTRLAIETARRLTERFPGGIWFVALADVREPERLLEAVAEAMGLPRSTTLNALEQIADTLRRTAQPALLVLDNFEQLVDSGGGEPLQSLLLRAPLLSCLVTTRQRLQIEGEQEVALAPLPIPTETTTPDRLMQYPAVSLFVNRAQSTRPDFQLTPRNAATVAQLCARLEGIPLALELAAAWTQMLTLAQILERLERRFDLLVARRRDVAGRHATLRATMEWSYQLLPPDLQQFFTRLSVFRGGWTLEAAEAVMDEPRALAFLAELRERSLIISEESAEPDRAVLGDEEATPSGPTMRFRMLESLREFAAEQVGSPARREELAERHRTYFLTLAEQAAPFLRGSAQIIELTRLDREHDNFRDALAWSLHRDETATEGLRLAVALTWFWLSRSYNREGRDWLERALARAESAPPTFRAAALRGAGWLAWRVHDAEQAVTLCEAGLALSRELADRKGIAFCLSILGEAAHHNGEGERGRALLEESVALARASGDLWIIGHCLTSLGHVLLPQGEPENACDRFEESLAAFRAQGDRYGIAETLKALSLIYCVLNRPDDAEQAVYESIALFHALGETDRVGMVHLILGYMAHDTQDYATARAHFDMTLRLCGEAGNRFGMAHALHNRAHAFFHDGKPDAAREDFEQSLPLFRDLGYSGDVALSLEGFALVALEERQWGRAARLYGAAATIRENAGVHLSETGRERVEEQMGRVREAIGEKRAQSAWDTGRALTVEQAVAFALGQ